MKYFFDTSALLPVFLDDHQHHESSHALFLSMAGKNCFCAGHSLAELFSTITRLPNAQRATASEAMVLLETLQGQFSFVVLEVPEYWSVLKRCSESGIVGGAIYDALIAQCAMKCGADVLYTWNISDFRRLGREIAKRIQTP